MRVAQIGAEGDDMTADSIAIVLTSLQRAYGEGVPEIMNAGSALTELPADRSIA